MADVGFSSSTSGAAVVASVAVARPQAQADAAAASHAATARNIADSVAFSVEAQTAVGVKAPEKASGNKTGAIKQSDSSQKAAQTAHLAAKLENSLTKMSGDVNKLMRMFGLSGEEATAVETKFSHKIAQKVGEPPSASLGLRAYVPFFGGSMALEARDIQVSFDTHVQDINVDFSTIAVTTPEAAIATTYTSQVAPLFVTPDGTNTQLTTDSNGVVVNANGEGTRELSSVLTGKTTIVGRDRFTDGKSATQAEADKTSFGAPQDVASSRFGEEAAPMDSNRDGVIDQQDSGFESLLVVKSGTATPLVEGGAVRVMFDAIVPVQDRYGPSVLNAAEQAIKPLKDVVTEAPATGYDVKA